MIGCNVLFLTNMMSIWNYLTDTYSNIKDKCKNMYYYMKDYYCGYHDMWLFVSGHTLPITLTNLNNTIDISWLYNNFNNRLTLANNNSDDPLLQYKFSWLSARIKVSNPNSLKGPQAEGSEKAEKAEETIEYEIDDFIEKFFVCSKSDVTPSLYTIFMCWCAYSKQWFKPDDKIEFYIIDDMGEACNLNIYNDNNRIIIKRNKLYVINHTEDKNSIETNTIMEIPNENNTIMKIPNENIPLKDKQSTKDE